MSISLNVSGSTAISSYSELQEEISAWLDRDDIDDRIPTFIQMAESYFNRELRTLDMETSYTFTVSGEDGSLPDDWLAMRAIYVEGSPDRPLRHLSPEGLRSEYLGQAGVPLAYAIVADGLRFGPVPSDTTTLTMDYYKAVENLTVTTPTNWLLLNNPDLYLFASLYFAELFLDNPPRAAQWQTLAEDILRRLKRASRVSKWGTAPRPQSGITQVRGATC